MHGLAPFLAALSDLTEEARAAIRVQLMTTKVFDSQRVGSRTFHNVTSDDRAGLNRVLDEVSHA